MKKFATAALIASAIAAVSAPAVSFAQDAAPTVEVKRGDMVYSSEGRRIANVYRVSSEGDAQLIYKGRMITISASTLTANEGKLTTSMTREEIDAIR